MSQSLERNKGFTVTLLGGAIVLLILATAGLDSRVLNFTTNPSGEPPVRAAAVDGYESLFDYGKFAGFVADGSSRDVFATTYFDKPKPNPKPRPGTREVSIAFMGAIENSGGGVTAFARVDNQLRKLSVGDEVLADWKVAAVTGRMLTLTNAAPTTNTVAFQKSINLIVPIR